MSARFDFSGKAVLVTGGAQGIGRRIVERFAASGARVLVADLQVEPAQALANELRAQGQDVQAAQVDLADHAAIARLFAGLAQLDVLVHNAAYFPLTEFQAITPAAIPLWRAWAVEVLMLVIMPPVFIQPCVEDSKSNCTNLNAPSTVSQ